jgi:CRP-like cAMP-binding protein
MSALPARVLRLVEHGPERRALEAGQLDAVIDPANGNVFLLPSARRALPAAGAPPPNRLLAALPRADYQRLLAGLERVTLTYGQVLYEPGERVRHVYFPADAHVSLLVAAEGGKALEVALVGREGMIGMALALGMDKSPVRARVQGTGTALRMAASAFREAVAGCPALQVEVHRYAYAKLAQARQTAACNRFHLVEARLARWLLMTRDRVRMDHFHLTHEFLADTLGVRRVGVTNAATELQRRKLIRYRRGEIRVLDHKGLEAAACSCYGIVKALAG